MRAARAYLLAAGRGRRAGGPKAWRSWQGTSLLEAQLEFLSELLAPENVFVAVQEPWLERGRALSPRAHFVAADPDGSPLGSLQRLLGAAPERGFVMHVDMPVFEPDVWKKLDEAEGDAVPVSGGRRGHPVLLTEATLREVAKLDPQTDRLDEFLRGKRIIEVEVETDVVLANLNGTTQ